MGGVSDLVIQAAQNAEQESIAKETQIRKDFLIGIITHSYSQAQAYTNIIIGAGYVAFFSIWGTTYHDLHAASKVWSIIFMILSVMVFVFWEVGKMIYTSRILLKQVDIVSIEDPIKFNKALADFTAKGNASTMTLGKIWTYVLVATISFAFISCCFLFYGLLNINFLI